MNEEEARHTAWKILGEVEEMMSGRGVGMLSRARNDKRREKAFFLDGEYARLEDTIVDIVRSAVAQAETPAPPSEHGGDVNG